MKHWRLFPIAATCLVVLTAVSAASAAPAPAERSGLDQVPASSPIVIYVRGVQGIRDRLVALMEKALPDVLKKFQTQMDDALTNGIKGRKLRGIPKDGPIFLAFTELPKPNENPPKMAVIVAVSNYKEFRDNLLTDEERKAVMVNGNGVESVKIENETTYFVDRKNFAIVTPNEDVANAFTKKQPGLDGKLSKEQAAKLMASDVGVYIAVDTLSKEYAEQMKQARQQIEQILDITAAQTADKAQKSGIETVKKAIGPIFQTIEDSQGVLLTAELRPSGLALHIESELRGGSPTAKKLEDAKPSAFKDLARMPDGRAYYSALKTSSALYKGLGSLLPGLADDKDSNESKEMAEALEELAKAKPSVYLDGYAFPIAGLQVYQYEDPTKAVAAQLKLFKAMKGGSSFQTGSLKDKPVIKTAAEKYGDFELNSVELVWDLEKMAEPIAAKEGEEGKKKFIDSMKAFMGEKLTIWFGTDGKKVVQVSAADWPTARKLLDQYFKGTKTIGAVKEFQEVRKEMPAEASYLGLIDVVQTGSSIAELFKPLFGNKVPPGWPAAPAKGTMSFIGLSVTLQPQRGSLDVFVSAAAAKEAYNAFIKPLLGE